MLLKFKPVREVKMVPERATDGSAGIDLRAVIGRKLVMQPGKLYRLPLGFAVEIPQGYVGLLTLRSGMGKRGLFLANGVGIIDCDYRGELIALLGTRKKFVLLPYARICQLVVVPYLVSDFEVVQELSETERGEGGLGHTGII